MKRRIRLPRLRKAPQRPVASEPGPQSARALQRLVAAEFARVLPSDVEMALAADVTPADITRAVKTWDDAQEAAGTGLDGLLIAGADDA